MDKREKLAVWEVTLSPNTSHQLVPAPLNMLASLAGSTRVFWSSALTVPVRPDTSNTNACNYICCMCLCVYTHANCTCIWLIYAEVLNYLPCMVLGAQAGEESGPLNPVPGLT